MAIAVALFNNGLSLIWGITTMIAIAPFSSFAIGLTYALIVNNVVPISNNLHYRACYVKYL